MNAARETLSVMGASQEDHGGYTTAFCIVVSLDRRGGGLNCFLHLVVRGEIDWASKPEHRQLCKIAPPD